MEEGKKLLDNLYSITIVMKEETIFLHVLHSGTTERERG